MKWKLKAGLLIVAAASMAACPFVALAGEDTGVFTVFRVLVGKPEPAAAAGPQVLDIPGPFVLLGRSAEEEAKDVLQLMDKLKESYRLAEMEIGGTTLVPLKQGVETAIPLPGEKCKDAAKPLPGEGVRMSVTMLAFDDTKALFGVSLAKEGEKPTVSKVLIARGERGVVGTRDGASAPYLFLTIEPLPVLKKGEPAGVVYPRVVNRVNPVYPEGARQARVEGVVILEATVGTDGAVRDLKPIRSEPAGLTEAAIKAVSQWRYEPARDASGKAISTTMALTINFRLH